MKQTLLLKNKVSEISRIVDFVHDIGECMGLTDEEHDELNLVIEEVAANVVHYAYPVEGEGDIEICAVWEGKHLVVTVTDKGVAFDPTTIEQPDLELPMEKITVGGWGIFLVRQLMDQMTYQRKEGKNVFTLEKSYSGSPMDK